MTAALLCALVLSPAADWQVNANNTLVWAGKPYLPVGLQIAGTPEAVATATKAGVKDLLLDLPVDGKGWAAAFKACDDAGARYMVSINTAPPMRDAVIIDPAGFRIADVTQKTTVDLAVPEASEAMLVLAAVRDGTVRWSKRVPVIDGHIKEEVDPLIDLPHVLLVYPIVRSLEAPDFFEGMDDQRDRLLSSLQKNPTGPGYRGLVDPLGARLQFPGESCQFVPTSRLFQTELASYLETKYSSIATALQAWGVSANDVKDFSQLSRLVPLWSDTRGVEQLWDVDSERLYKADRRTSIAWRDIRTVLRSVAARRTKNLIDNLKTQTKGPVISTWTGWNSSVTIPDVPFDGLAFQPNTDSIPALIDDTSKPVSALLKRNEPGLAMAVGLQSVQGGPSIEDIVGELEGIGVRAWFARSSDPAVMTAIAKLEGDRITDTSDSEWRIVPLYYPESAHDPAQSMRLTGGLWWLPAPGKGQRIVYGAGIEGYRDESTPEPTIVLWSTDTPKKVSLRFNDPKSVMVRAMDGQPIPFRVKKNNVEFDLPTTPILIKGSEETPVPESAFLETTGMITVLLDGFESQVNPEGNERFVFSDNIKGFDRSPSASFAALRAQLGRMLPRAAPFVWVACSRSPKHNFGETAASAGSASENVLTVSNRFSPAEGMFYAEFPLSARRPGTYEIWLAARIPSELRDKVRIRAGDKLLGPPDKPVSFYGDGFGWYKFGQVELLKALTNFRFECPATGKVSMALDVIHIAIPGFRPQGPRVPVEWLKSIPIKSSKPGKG